MATATTEAVLYEVHANVAHIGLNRPDRLNALSPAMLGALRHAITAAPDDGARAILLYGKGRCFCAGADLTTAGGRDAGEKLREDYHPVARALHRSPIPIVAAVQGITAGGGAGLALAADIVVMERTAALAFVFARLGLVPDVGATWLLARSIGRARTLDLALTGARISGEAALDAGLVARIAEEGQAYALAEALAATLAGLPTVALGLIRSQVSAALEIGFDDILEIEAVNQSHASPTADFTEALTAFRDKRRPTFLGR